jgi:hypothetical protein
MFVTRLCTKLHISIISLNIFFRFFFYALVLMYLVLFARFVP